MSNGITGTGYSIPLIWTALLVNSPFATSRRSVSGTVDVQEILSTVAPSTNCSTFVFPQNDNTVILSGAPHRFIAQNSACGAESKDPGDAYLTDAVRAFSTTEAREQDLPVIRTRWSRVHLVNQTCPN
jgi:hypothetical protein